jgi:hypothetical protein
MAGLEDMIRSSAPGGNIGKPLLIALLALLASGALFRGGRAGPAASTSSPPTSDDGAGGLLGGLAGYWTNCRRVGWATWPIPGSVLAKMSWCRIISSVQRFGPDIIKTLAQRSGLSEEELTKQLSQFCRGRRQADPRWPTADVGGVI